MFGVSKKLLVKGLRNVQKRLCCYGPDAPTCNCKYGVELDSSRTSSELTGCPEVGMAIKLLNAMDPSTFRQLCRKAEVVLVRGEDDESEDTSDIDEKPLITVSISIEHMRTRIDLYFDFIPSREQIEAAFKNQYHFWEEAPALWQSGIDRIRTGKFNVIYDTLSTRRKTKST